MSIGQIAIFHRIDHQRLDGQFGSPSLARSSGHRKSQPSSGPLPDIENFLQRAAHGLAVDADARLHSVCASNDGCSQFHFVYVSVIASTIRYRHHSQAAGQRIQDFIPFRLRLNSCALARFALSPPNLQYASSNVGFSCGRVGVFRNGFQCGPRT